MDTVNWKDWLTEEEQEALALTEKMGELLYGGIRPGVIRLFRSLAASRALVVEKDLVLKVVSNSYHDMLRGHEGYTFRACPENLCPAARRALALTEAEMRERLG